MTLWSACAWLVGIFLCLAGSHPIFEMFRANRKVAAKDIDPASFWALSTEDLKAFVESEWTRAKELDDKQQKLTGALSIAVTVGGLAGSTILQELNASFAKDVAAALFLVAAVLLVAGTFVAFKSLSPKKRYGYGAPYLAIISVGGIDARREMVKAATEFQRDNTIRSNEAAAATASIRNGMLALAFGLVASLFAAAGGKQQPSEDARPPLVFTQTTSLRGS